MQPIQRCALLLSVKRPRVSAGPLAAQRGRSTARARRASGARRGRPPGRRVPRLYPGGPRAGRSRGGPERLLLLPQRNGFRVLVAPEQHGPGPVVVRRRAVLAGPPPGMANPADRVNKGACCRLTMPWHRKSRPAGAARVRPDRGRAAGDCRRRCEARGTVA